MEKYSKAVSEMYSQFKKEAHPLEKYIWRLAYCRGEKLEVVGYSSFKGAPVLIVDASQCGGWADIDLHDVVFKECESYLYVSIDDLID
jgi:hypothetical protein